MRRLGPVIVALSLGAAVPAVPEDRPGSAPKPPPLAPAAPTPSAVDGVAGSYTFRTYCASCHGADGKGEGPMAANLRFQPPDLTLISRRNGGSFPAERVQRIVDGRKPLKGHGGSDMPIWGDAFKDADSGYDEAQAKARVQSVVDYLKTIQAR